METSQFAVFGVAPGAVHTVGSFEPAGKSRKLCVPGSQYVALYHSLSLGRKMFAPGLAVNVVPLLGVSVPPSNVYAPVSVSAGFPGSPTVTRSIVTAEAGPARTARPGSSRSDHPQETRVRICLPLPGADPGAGLLFWDRTP
jgi:hypothetical protein